MRALKALLVPLMLPLILGACVMVEPPNRASTSPGALPDMAVFRAARATPPDRSNAQMARDFLDLSFQMESGRKLDSLSRFEGPITVAVTGGAPPTLIPDLDRLITRLRNEADISISRVPGPNASITIETLPRAQMQRVVPNAACFVVPRISSWEEFRRTQNTSLIDWTTLQTRDRVAIFIPSDVAPQEIRDCLHEELAQAIGPLNDLYRLSDSVFNDDNFHAVLTGFDMLVLRAYNDPALSSGMTRDQVAQRLPGLLNRLNPRGAGGGVAPIGATPRSWALLIETALSRGERSPRRRAAAREALAVAQARGWSDTRLGFAYFALGRLSLGQSDSSAITAFQSAASVFDRVNPGGIQAAHVQMQLAAFSLSAGDLQGTLTRTEAALPAARQAENAALMATLMMLRAEALEGLGRLDAAERMRLDSLRWGRYGFGDAREVNARLREIATLAP